MREVLANILESDVILATGIHIEPLFEQEIQLLLAI